MENKLPKGWKRKVISSIAKTTSGGTPNRAKKEFWENGTIPWLKSGELNDNMCISLYEECITDLGLENSSAKLFPKGTLLIALYGATAGKLGILNINASTNQAVCSIQQKGKEKHFDEKFLFYFLLTKREEIIRDSFGGAQPNISKKYIDEIKIPIPESLTEQHRIVAKIDRIFERLDKSIDLVEENIGRAKALKASILSKNFHEGEELPEEWKEDFIKNVCIVNPKKSEVKDLPTNTLVSFLPMSDLQEHAMYFQAKDSKTIDEVYAGYTYFRDNDVLLAKVTPCFENGKAGVANNLTNGIGFGSSEYHILRSKGGILPEWIYYNIMMPKFRIIGTKEMTGSSGLKRVPPVFVSNWQIRFPKSITEQQRVVAQLDHLFSRIDRIIAEQGNKLQQLKALKASVLDKAFRGEM